MTENDKHRQRQGLQDPRLIMAAHDLIARILSGAVPNPLPGDETRLGHFAQVLCWVVGHIDDGTPGGEFQELLRNLTDFMLAAIAAEDLAKRSGRHKVN